MKPSEAGPGWSDLFEKGPEKEPKPGELVIFDGENDIGEIKDGIACFGLYQTPVTNLKASESTGFTNKGGAPTAGWAIKDASLVKPITDTAE